MQGHHRSERRGAVHARLAWSLVVAITAILAGLVAVFIANLPEPPRYDELTIDPGSRIPDRPPIAVVLRRTTDDGEVERSWRAGSIDFVGQPVIPEAIGWALDPSERSWSLEGGLMALFDEPELVRFEIAAEGVRWSIESEETLLASGEAAGFERSTLEQLMPKGSTPLRVVIEPTGATPSFVVAWTDEQGIGRTLAELGSARAGEAGAATP